MFSRGKATEGLRDCASGFFKETLQKDWGTVLQCFFRRIHTEGLRDCASLIFLGNLKEGLGDCTSVFSRGNPTEVIETVLQCFPEEIVQKDVVKRFPMEIF